MRPRTRRAAVLPGDSATGSDSGAGQGPGHIQHVGVLAARNPSTGAFSDSFSIQVAKAGDLVLLFTGCETAQASASASIVVAGWNVMPLTDASGGASGRFVGAFYAIAPDTNASFASVSWNVSGCSDLIVFAEDFRSDTGTIAIDGQSATIANGSCDALYTLQHTGAAVWVGCHPTMFINDVATGWTKGADDGTGDWAEYKLTTDPAGTQEHASFAVSGDYAASAVGIFAP